MQEVAKHSRSYRLDLDASLFNNLPSEPPGGGDSQMKQTGMLVVSLRGYKFWILVLFRVFQAKRQYFKLPRSRLRFCEETKNYPKRKRSQIFFFLPFFLFEQSLLGVKICLRHAQISLLKRLNSKFPTSIPVCSI